MLHAVVFYLFSAVLLGSALMVESARNPVHAVLFLILAFFNAAGLFLLIGAEFIAFILVIVYVGAVAVLFLFVVMMLDMDFRELRKGLAKYLPLGIGVAAVLAVELCFMAWHWVADSKTVTAAGPADAVVVDNTRAIGRVLYTDYFFPFQVSGLILLVAMIGAIALTLRHRGGVRRQRSSVQLNRTTAEAIEVRKVESGKGVL